MPAWDTRTVIDGHNAVVYAQVAGTVAAPGAGDELGFITSVSFANEPEVSERGPYINSAQKKKTLSSYSASGELSIDVADGADTVRARFFTAISAKTRLKITVLINGSTGEKHVMDQCVMGVSVDGDPAEGWTYGLPFDSDTYVYTAATV